MVMVWADGLLVYDLFAIQRKDEKKKKKKDVCKVGGVRRMCEMDRVESVCRTCLVLLLR